MVGFCLQNKVAQVVWALGITATMKAVVYLPVGTRRLSVARHLQARNVLFLNQRCDVLSKIFGAF